jgi:hypothetical protein
MYLTSTMHLSYRTRSDDAFQLLDSGEKLAKEQEQLQQMVRAVVGKLVEAEAVSADIGTQHALLM